MTGGAGKPGSISIFWRLDLGAANKGSHVVQYGVVQNIKKNFAPTEAIPLPLCCYTHVEDARPSPGASSKSDVLHEMTMLAILVENVDIPHSAEMSSGKN